MRKTIVLSAIVLAVAVAGAWVAVETGTATAAEGTRIEHARLEVRGMESFLCELGVRHALKSVDGVSEVSVDRQAAEAEVGFDPEAASIEELVAAVSALGYRASLKDGADGGLEESGEGLSAVRAHAVDGERASEEEIDRVARWVAAHVLETGELPEGGEVVEATGIALTEGDFPRVQRAVVAELAADPAGRELLAGSRCSDYGACSLWGNLAGASGETLERFDREKAEDGATLTELELPSFTARALAGEEVTSDGLRGHPALLAFLAGHCNHSIDSLSILQELERRYGPEGLQVVAVMVNSGSVEDVAAWMPHFAPEYEVWIHPQDSLGDAIGSHLVPTYLVIDAEGRVRTKLVGFKSRQEIAARLERTGVG